MQTYLSTLRPEIINLPAYNSGLSSEFVRSTYHVDTIAKLGSNENPFGASPRVASALLAAISESAVYPSSHCDELRLVLSDKLNVAPERLIFGNGSEDLISVCAHTFLSSGDEFASIVPSFGLHVIYPQSLGACFRGVSLEADYSLDMRKLLGACSPRTRMIVFSSPSNPVGTSISAEDMRLLLANIGRDTFLLFDEAYYEYAAADQPYPDFLQMLDEADQPWLLLRTFSKAYGLAGLRIGYGIGSHASLIDLMNRTRTPFNVNRLAQVAAIAALDDPAHVVSCVQRTIAGRHRLSQGLTALGYRHAPSDANFLFFDAREPAAALAARLLPFGVIVKPWQEPGYTHHIRVSVGTPEANDQFLAALVQTAQPH